MGIWCIVRLNSLFVGLWVKITQSTESDLRVYSVLNG